MARKLRSAEWFGGVSKDAFARRGWMKNHGYPDDAFEGRPVIGICNTFSQFTPCNAHFRGLAEHIKAGVLEAGGLPLEFPVFSCGESNLRPTAMLFRNLASMDVEEAIRGNPMDGVILMAGCDKTTPSLLMGAASCDLPSIVISGGPMLNGKFRGRDIGSGTDVFRFIDDVRAGDMSIADFLAAENGIARSPGHCMTMGTASTMASMAESLGVALPGNAAHPAVDANRLRLARLTGRRAVEMVREDLRLSKILTKPAFANAIRMNGAIGGSTNAVLHLIAIAGRIGVDLTLDDWDRYGADVPTIVNLMPSGQYLMEDFCYAGGIPAVMKEVADCLNLDVMTATGKTLGENIAKAVNWNDDVIRPRARALVSNGGIAVLRGNLAPQGAVIKPSAAAPALMTHRGPAIVFNSIEHYKARVDDPDLDINENSVMVLQNCGPRGYPGMAEVGNMALPQKLLKRGVRDMVRISDARMSGTAFGTVVLHTAPEAAIGGPLALVRDGDMIELCVAERRLHLEVSDAVLTRRLASWTPPEPLMKGGYQSLYVERVMQADAGVDLSWVVGATRRRARAIDRCWRSVRSCVNTDAGRPLGANRLQIAIQPALDVSVQHGRARTASVDSDAQ